MNQTCYVTLPDLSPKQHIVTLLVGINICLYTSWEPFQMEKVDELIWTKFTSAITGGIYHHSSHKKERLHQKQDLLFGRIAVTVCMKTTTTPSNMWMWGPFHHGPWSFMQESRFSKFLPQPNTRSYSQPSKDHMSWCIDPTGTPVTNWWIATWKNCKYHRWGKRRYCC